MVQLELNVNRCSMLAVYMHERTNVQKLGYKPFTIARLQFTAHSVNNVEMIIMHYSASSCRSVMFLRKIEFQYQSSNELAGKSYINQILVLVFFSRYYVSKLRYSDKLDRYYRISISDEMKIPKKASSILDDFC